MIPKTVLSLMLLSSLTLAQVPQPSNSTQSEAAQDDKDDVVRITTNLVQVDVVVTKNGKIVRDLQPTDFEIFQDGKRQTISNFLYVSNTRNEASTTIAPTITNNNKPVPLAPPPIKHNEARRIMALVVDDLGLSAESMAHVRKQLRTFVDEQMEPNDLVAIIRTGGDIGALQQFTNDKRLLQAAIKQARWNMCSRMGTSVFASVSAIPIPGNTGGSPCGWESIRSSLGSIRFILQAMGELPGRKSMVLFSDSLPRQEQEQEITAPTEDSSSQFDARNYYGLLQRLAEIAIRNSVVIYGVDTQGLQYTGPTAADAIRGSGVGALSTRSLNDQIVALRRQRSTQLVTRREGSDILSRETGGFLVKNSNDFRLDRIMEDQQGYYLLGYRPTAETFNRRFHHITARVKGSGLSLRTRKGFYGFTEDEANRLRVGENKSTDLALTSPFSAHDIAIDLATVFANDQVSGSILRSFLYIDAKDVTFTDDGDGWHKVTVEMRGVIFGNNGRQLDQIVVTPTVRLRQKAYEQALSDGLVLRFDMPAKRPGAYQLRVMARDLASSRVGSAGQFVSVPDLQNRKFALSGLVLSGESNAKIITITAPPLSGNTSDISSGQPELSTSPVNRRFVAGTNLLFACVVYNAAINANRQPELAVEAKLFREAKLVMSMDRMAVNVTGQKDLTRLVASGIVRLRPDLEPGRYFLQLVMTDLASKDKRREEMQWIDFEVVSR